MKVKGRALSHKTHARCALRHVVVEGSNGTYTVPAVSENLTITVTEAEELRALAVKIVVCEKSEDAEDTEACPCEN